MKRYAESLEKTIQHNYSHLKEMVEDFKGLCLVVTPEKHTPQDIIVEIREPLQRDSGPTGRDQSHPATPPGKIQTVLSPGFPARQNDHGIRISHQKSLLQV